MRIAHVVAAPVGAATVNGVTEMVRCLAAAQSEADHHVSVFASVGRDRAVIADLLAWHPDIVHFHSVHVPEHVLLAARLHRRGIPYAVTVHGGLFPAALRRGRLKKAAFGLLFERTYFNSARFVHALSAYEAEAIRRYGVRCALAVVPNALPTEAGLRPSQPDALYRTYPHLRQQRILMFVGRLDPRHKGLDLAIEGFARAAVANTVLVLVGPDVRGSRRSLERLSRACGVPDAVIFSGAAVGQDRADLLAAADVFLHPSRWEGLSLSVLNAAAAGKPCLVTRCADPLNALERARAAIIIEPTVEGVATGIRRVLALDARELELMGARARHAAQRHPGWAEVADRLTRAYAAGTAADRIEAGQRNRSWISSR